jgi:hypothetical protein
MANSNQLITSTAPLVTTAGNIAIPKATASVDGYLSHTDFATFAAGGSGVSSLNSLTGPVTLAAGSNVTLTPSGSTITIAASGGGGGGQFLIDPTSSSNAIERFDDFFAYALSPTANGPVGPMAFAFQNVNTISPVVGEQNRVGQIQLDTTGGTAGFFSAFQPIMFGGASHTIAASFNLSAVGVSGSNGYSFKFGFQDSFPNYNNAFVSFNINYLNATWQVWTDSPAGANNYVDTGVAVVANAWTNLRISVNAAGTQAQFYINGVLTNTITTDIPNANGIGIGAALGLYGGGPFQAKCDWVYHRYQISTNRGVF